MKLWYDTPFLRYEPGHDIGFLYEGRYCCIILAQCYCGASPRTIIPALKKH